LSARLFVGNLSYDATEAELREAFSEAGEVTQVRIPQDRETGRPRGFAFVDMASPEQAAAALAQLDQRPLRGRPMAVKEAVARDASGPPTRRFEGRPSDGPSTGRAEAHAGPPRAMRPGGPPPRGDTPPPFRGPGPPSADPAFMTFTPDARRRDFGPDAAPRGKRRSDPWDVKGERGPKAAVVRRPKTLDYDDDLDDDDLDAVPFWEEHEVDEEDED